MLRNAHRKHGSTDHWLVLCSVEPMRCDPEIGAGSGCGRGQGRTSAKGSRRRRRGAPNPQTSVTRHCSLHVVISRRHAKRRWLVTCSLRSENPSRYGLRICDRHVLRQLPVRGAADSQNVSGAKSGQVCDFLISTLCTSHPSCLPSSLSANLPHVCLLFLLSYSGM